MEMSLSSSATAAAAAAQGQLDKATAHFWEQRREFRADLARAKRLAMAPPEGQDDHPEVSLYTFNLKPSVFITSMIKNGVCMMLHTCVVPHANINSACRLNLRILQWNTTDSCTRSGMPWFCRAMHLLFSLCTDALTMPL
jgi:hypothetical protein